MNNEKYRKFSPIILDWLKLPVNELYNINNIYNAIIIKFNIETNNNFLFEKIPLNLSNQKLFNTTKKYMTIDNIISYIMFYYSKIRFLPNILNWLNLSYFELYCFQDIKDALMKKELIKTKKDFIKLDEYGHELFKIKKKCIYIDNAFLYIIKNYVMDFMFYEYNQKPIKVDYKLLNI